MEWVLVVTNQINAWVILVFAIFCSAVGTTSLKFLGDGGSRFFLVGVVGGYALFLFLITLVLSRIEMSIGYAVWAGLSTVLMTLSGVVFFGDQLSSKKTIGLLLIIVGVVGLNLADASVLI